MRHGYTNHTDLHGDLVVKRYDGPDTARRAAVERHTLRAVGGSVPVPEVVANSRTSLTTAYVDGQHGQDLIDSGMAHDVLAECGRVLRELHSLDPRHRGFRTSDGVIQHGDFGPNNVIFGTGPVRAIAVLDWEFSGLGPAIVDLAWCEWIVRMHHPRALGSLPGFFAAYGTRPPWAERQAEMLRRCEWLENFCRRWDPAHPGIEQWQARREHTASWRALPDDDR